MVDDVRPVILDSVFDNKFSTQHAVHICTQLL